MRPSPHDLPCVCGACLILRGGKGVFYQHAAPPALRCSETPHSCSYTEGRAGRVQGMAAPAPLTLAWRTMCSLLDYCPHPGGLLGWLDGADGQVMVAETQGSPAGSSSCRGRDPRGFYSARPSWVATWERSEGMLFPKRLQPHSESMSPCPPI